MAEKDASEKILESYNDVFSDIVNVLLFNGRQVLGCLLYTSQERPSRFTRSCPAASAVRHWIWHPITPTPATQMCIRDRGCDVQTGNAAVALRIGSGSALKVEVDVYKRQAHDTRRAQPGCIAAKPCHAFHPPQHDAPGRLHRSGCEAGV